jgi:hypothetical protein
VDAIVVVEPEAKDDALSALTGSFEISYDEWSVWNDRIDAASTKRVRNDAIGNIIGRRAAAELRMDDIVNIGIELTASDREELGALARMVRRIIYNEFVWARRYAVLRDSVDFNLEDCNNFQLMVVREYDDVFHEIPYDYQMSADPVQYDSMKPCYWQVLHYQCNVENTDEDDEQDEE